MTQSWDVPDRLATAREAVVSRRRWLRRVGWGALGGTAVGAAAWWLHDDASDAAVLAAGRYDAAGADLYPAPEHPRFAEVGRELTDEAAAARYTNFYEFSELKWVWRWVGSFQPTSWTLTVGGLVAKPKIYDLDDLLRAFPLEQRVYRHRCVEAWAMTVPWTGFPLASLLRQAEPLPEARFVRFVSFDHPGRSAGPWPYSEGLTLAEATHELAFVATGMYGHPLLKQHGAPVRLVVPWKYGFKSAKSLVRIELTAVRPATFWNTLAPHEYGFEANVDPAVPHPRWSQASERLLGTGERVPTRKYNGYGEWVGRLYSS